MYIKQNEDNVKREPQTPTPSHVKLPSPAHPPPPATAHIETPLGSKESPTTRHIRYCVGVTGRLAQSRPEESSYCDRHNVSRPARSL